MLNEGRVVIREERASLSDKEDNLLNMEAEIEKFISDCNDNNENTGRQ